MKDKKPDQLLPLLESFFRAHLTSVRGASPHTIRAYRDTLRLFFSFLAEHQGKDVAKLQLDDICVEAVANFLVHIEVKRGNSAVSRNCRLAAIRSFIKHLIRNDLQRVGQYQRILALPSKKTHTPLATYLEPDEVRLILQQPDHRSSIGLRHYALLLFLYNTGARVSEAIAVQVGDLYLSPPRQVVLHGKGNKDRLCPLWKDTVPHSVATALPISSASMFHWQRQNGLFYVVERLRRMYFGIVVLWRSCKLEWISQ